MSPTLHKFRVINSLTTSLERILIRI